MANYQESVNDGGFVGQWVKCDGGQIGLVAIDGQHPYICFYPPKIEAVTLPHAIFVRDGDMQIQVPQPSGKPRYLSVNKILDHLSGSCECECDFPVEAPKPG